MTILKSNKYYQDKIRIDKRQNKNTAYKIQLYNNNTIDSYVKSYNEGTPTKPAPAVMYAELSILNKPQVYANYNRIINSPYTSNGNLEKMLVKNMANKDMNRIVEAELERMVKNLNYVEQVMNRYEIPQKQYESLIKEQEVNSLANRQKILEEVGIKANDLLVSEGLNIPSAYSYRDLDTTAESLMRQSQMASDYEKALAMNEEAISNGEQPVYNKKRWVWTGAGDTTRHESNEGQVRNLEEDFIVVNDKTLDIDEMAYPSDPAGSPSNSYICYCEVEYFYEPDDEIPNPNEPAMDVIDLPHTKPEAYQPEVKFDTTVSSLPKINASPQFFADAKANEYLKQNQELFMPKESKGSYIDVDSYKSYEFTYDESDGTYLVDHTLLTKNTNGKWELNGLEMEKDYDTFSAISKDKIDAHNSQFVNEKTSIGEEMDLPKTETDNSLTGEVKSKGEFIDTSLLEELDSESWHISHYDNHIKNDLSYNEETGYWEYKGLKIEGSEKDNPSGWIDKVDVEAHNQQFNKTETTTEPVKIDNTKIDTTGLYYDETVKEYTVFDHDGIVDVGSKKMYKGLDITQYYNYENKWADIPEQVIKEHNNKTVETTEPTNTKKQIFNDEVIYSKEDGGYLIETFNLEKIDGKYYYKGLEVKVSDKNNMYQLIPEKEFKNHNKQFKIKETSDNKYDFKPIVETREYVHNKKSKVLEYGKDATGQSYAVNKKTGRQYILDERAKYEKRQDALQNQVDMTKQYDAVNDWGGGGYRKINHFNYNKKTFEGETYRKLRDEIHPVLDQMRSKLSKGESIDALEKKFNNIKNKYINEGLISARDSVFRIIDEIKDIDTAMVKAPELQQDTCFIRAGAWKLEFNKIGEIFEWEGFAGITYKNRPVDLGHEDLSYNITILAPKGVKGVRISKQFDGLTGEREWLLPRGQKFKVLEFDETAQTCTIELIIDETWS